MESMRTCRWRATTVATIGGICLGGATIGCDGGSPVARAAEPVLHGETRIAPRIPYLAEHPCEEQCHVEREADPTPRVLIEFHTDRKVDHGLTNSRWCPDCHNPDDYDYLRLDDGTNVSFDQAYRLCGQCHAPKLRDWKRGIHGVETGSWTEGALRRSCPVCHDPHDPARPDFVSLPPPAPPREPWPRGHLSAAADRSGDEGGHDAPR